jgi:hypothetical protein
VIHVKWFPCYHNMAHPQVCGWNGQRPDKMGSCSCVEWALEDNSSLRDGRGANNLSLRTTSTLRNVKRSQTRKDTLARSKQQKMELKFYITYGARVRNGLKWLRISHWLSPVNTVVTWFKPGGWFVTSWITVSFERTTVLQYLNTGKRYLCFINLVCGEGPAAEASDSPQPWGLLFINLNLCIISTAERTQ